jgi:hypothetical protein
MTSIRYAGVATVAMRAGSASQTSSGEKGGWDAVGPTARVAGILAERRRLEFCQQLGGFAGQPDQLQAARRGVGRRERPEHHGVACDAQASAPRELSDADLVGQRPVRVPTDERRLAPVIHGEDAVGRDVHGQRLRVGEAADMGSGVPALELCSRRSGDRIKSDRPDQLPSCTETATMSTRGTPSVVSR